jgi:hypothetical protein
MRRSSPNLFWSVIDKQCKSLYFEMDTFNSIERESRKMNRIAKKEKYALLTSLPSLFFKKKKR